MPGSMGRARLGDGKVRWSDRTARLASDLNEHRKKGCVGQKPLMQYWGGAKPVSVAVPGVERLSFDDGQASASDV